MPIEPDLLLKYQTIAELAAALDTIPHVLARTSQSQEDDVALRDASGACGTTLSGDGEDFSCSAAQDFTSEVLPRNNTVIESLGSTSEVKS